LISATIVGDQIRISVDDVVEELDRSGSWVQREHVTNKAVSGQKLKELTFDERELADFAHFVLARLSAFGERGEI